MGYFRCAFGALALALFLVACNGNSAVSHGFLSAAASPGASRVPDHRRTGSQQIQHVVIIMQENRSFNNLFMNFPGATTATYGYTHKNRKITLRPISLSTAWDLAHNSQGFYAACNGTGSIPGTNCQMNGFDREPVTCGLASQPVCPVKYPQYIYAPRSETAPYWSMAKQYVLADQMFASNFDASSYVSHQYIIAGQAGSAINYPLTWWGCPGGSTDTVLTIQQNPPRGYGPAVTDCFDYATLGDELDAAGISWAYYAAPVGKGGTPCGQGAHGIGPAYKDTNGIWTAYQAVKHICYGPDWNNDVITPQTNFLSDVTAGKLRSVSWVVPTCANSDHPGCSSSTGPSWVASLVNAVGESQYWDSTAIFIMWDDYGGLYDPVAPQYLDYDGLGMRVPLIVVSPYAKQAYVSHVQYEHGSILKFVESRFGLAPLAASDGRANSPAQDCFDFTQAPRKFVPIKAPYGRRFFMRQPLDRRPPDAG